MDGELVEESPPVTQGDDGNHSPFLYTEIFERECPYYMAIGMTYEEYWNGDNCLPKYYRKAEEERLKKTNFNAWLQGFYVYEALLDVFPVFNPNVRNHKPSEYMKKPVPITDEDVRIANEEKEKEEAEKGIRMLMDMMKH